MSLKVEGGNCKECDRCRNTWRRWEWLKGKMWRRGNVLKEINKIEHAKEIAKIISSLAKKIRLWEIIYKVIRIFANKITFMVKMIMLHAHLKIYMRKRGRVRSNSGSEEIERKVENPTVRSYLGFAKFSVLNVFFIAHLICI